MKRTSKGFTVVELVIVIAVIAILAGVLIPTFSALARNSRQNAAYQQASAEYLLYRTTKSLEPGEELAKNVFIYVKYESEDYFFVALNNASSVDEEPKKNNVVYEQLQIEEDGVTKDVINLQTYSTTAEVAANVTLQTPQNTFNIKAGDLSVGLSGELANVVIFKLDSLQEPYNPVIPDSVIPQGKEVGDEIEFGSYPQSDVTSSLGLTLEKFTGIRDGNGDFVLNASGKTAFLPVEGEEYHEIKYDEAMHSYMWKSYKYYDNGVPSDYAWYVDIAYGKNEKGEDQMYRGVYFVKYRPAYTTKAAFTDPTENRYRSGSNWIYEEYQYSNGYLINNIYWFKYEPIVWTITGRTEVKANGVFDHYNYTLRCNNILDAQHFQSQIAEIDGKYTNISNNLVQLTVVKDGETIDEDIAANNWQSSEVKQWLGVKSQSGWDGTFVNWAFSDNDLTRVEKSSIKNNGGWDYYKGEYGYYENGLYYGGHYLRGQKLRVYDENANYSDVNWIDKFGNWAYGSLVYNVDIPPRYTWYHNVYGSGPTDPRFGDQQLLNNYFWLPSYEEFVGYKVGENIGKSSDTTWTGVMKGYVDMQHDQSACAQVSAYAVAQGAYKGSNGNGTYWLRSNSGRNTRNVNFAGWDNLGTLGYNDYAVDTSSGNNCHLVTASYLGIRPCTCIRDR